MLKLKFVEKAGINLENLVEETLEFSGGIPLVIGHRGDVTPKITNGHISRVHATVTYNDEMKVWTVIDGFSDGSRASRNGLYAENGDRILKSIHLVNEGDKVYLINILENVAYLEVFDESRTKISSTERTTAGLEIQLAKIEVKTEVVAKKVETIASTVVANKEHIQEVNQKAFELETKVSLISQTVDQALDQVSEIGTNPKVYFMGATISFFMFSLFILGLLAYQNLDRIADQLLQKQERIEKLEKIKPI